MCNLVGMVIYIAILIWVGIIFGLSAIQNPSNLGSSITFSIVVHIIEYATLTFLIVVALYRTNHFSKLIILFGISLILVSLYAVSDEFHQSFVPGREATIQDLIFDLLGIGLGMVIWKFGHFIKVRLTR
jgi:VanZ family protein